MQVLVEGKFDPTAVEVMRDCYPDYQWNRGLSRRIMIGTTNKDQLEVERQMDNLNGRWFNIEGYTIIEEN